MKSDRRVPVAIIGGGFSGTITAAQLARRGIRSVLIDGSGRAGKGVAYSTTEPAHLLNVRAEGMSAWADEPDHFARRFESEGGDRRGFAQRRLFGRYLGEILDEAVASGNVEVVPRQRIEGDARGRQLAIALDDGESLQAGALVLAVGNQEPEGAQRFRGSRRQRSSAIRGERRHRRRSRTLAASGASALLVGTGLTMVDLVLSLDSAGHQGRIVALSRRGQIPRSHADFEPAPVEQDEVPHGDLRGLWRWLRRRAGEVGWRAAVDSLRPYSHPLVAGPQRRAAAPLSAPRAALVGRPSPPHRAGGRADRRPAGRRGSARSRGRADRLGSRLRWRPGSRRIAGAARARRAASGSLAPSTAPDRCIRSHGPGTRCSAACSMAATPAPTSSASALKVDDRSRVAGGEHLWALGPLTKGRYWEIIAVPDIREQAAAVADDIARELGP